jgi:hypothetical protein
MSCHVVLTRCDVTASEQVQLDRLVDEFQDLDDKVDELRRHAAATDEIRKAQGEAIARVEAQVRDHSAETTRRFDALGAKLDAMKASQAQGWTPKEITALVIGIPGILAGLASVLYALSGHEPPALPLAPAPPAELLSPSGAP